MSHWVRRASRCSQHSTISCTHLLQWPSGGCERSVCNCLASLVRESERGSFLPFIDKALARRLESAEEIPQVEYARLYGELRPNIGCAFEPICGGHMIFAGLNSPLGRAVGMGFDGPVKDTDLERLECFYRSHRAPAQLDICPLSDGSLLELVKGRGYTIAEMNNVLYRRLENVDAFWPAPEVEILPGRPEEALRFSEIVTRSFFDKGGEPEGFAAMLAPMFQCARTLTFFARVSGEPVAVAAGMAIPDHGIFALFGAGTLPEARGRGIQTALLRTRLRVAADAGCEMAVVVTQGGSVSERNCVRVGFQVAYSKVTVLKHVHEG
jgi:GNAT superfamily N-acetyltransferase